MPFSAARRFSAWGQILSGTLICSLAYTMLLIPNDIAPGGFTGIAQLIAHAASWRIGTLTLCLNLPLFALSARTLGLSFCLRSLTATVMLSALIDFMPAPALIPPDTPERMLLASIFGGVLSGIGFGLILRGGATTGGTDMLAKLIKERFPPVKLGSIMFSVDASVIAASALVFDPVSALFALISAFLMSHVIDTMVDGLNRAHAYFIISDRHAEIAERILTELKRGATCLMGYGMYSRKNKEIILCVVSRTEASRLRAIVSETDPIAFMIAASVHEVLGKGFLPHDVQASKYTHDKFPARRKRP